MTDLDSWWSNLKPQTREALMADPYGPVPTDLATEVAKAGAPLSAAWWTESQSGPDAWHLPGEAARYVERWTLCKAYTDAVEAHRRGIEEFFAIDDASQPIRLPNRTITEESIQELARLQEAEAAAETAWLNAWR
ncbi:hypothetical protein [Angustibacter sp. Root456]|uniref:hypothetical protein n=1 Tax=Angustibacter sp. Root456 TaxID=1736539 RepID=UPI0012FB4602|nr:hypothetical protein [Angustibacter sp. Root456]